MNNVGENLITSGGTVLLALVGLGIIATLVSKNANTPQILKSGFSGFGAAITAAEGPVLGGFGGGSYGSTFGDAGYHD